MKKTWKEIIEGVLGRADPDARDHYYVRRAWLYEAFKICPADADEQTIIYYSKAYILGLLANILFPDTSGDTTNAHWVCLLEGSAEEIAEYNWGSAVLAYLYRAMCKACKIGVRGVAGCVLLLQLWAYEHLHIGRPTYSLRDLPVVEAANMRMCLGWTWAIAVRQTGKNPTHSLVLYRDMLDRQTEDDIIWQPYTEDRIEHTHPNCIDENELYLRELALICFHVIEHYYPSRVMRQFGYGQPIPTPVLHDRGLHRTN